MPSQSQFSTFSLPRVSGATFIKPYSSVAPMIQGEPKNESPFTRTPTTSAKLPAGPGYTQSQVDASLAANPNASKGGYEGAVAMPAQYGKSTSKSMFDLSTDPIVQKIKAMNDRTWGEAVSSTDAARKQLLIDSGFGDLARATNFGSLEQPQTGDEATALAAEANPYSIAANLMRAHAQAQTGIDQADNNANLFFSSARANHLGDEAHQYLGNVTSAQGQIRQQLTDLVTNLLNERSRENDALAGGYSDARTAAVNNAATRGEYVVDYDANGNPIFSGSNGNPDTTATVPSIDAIAASLAANPNASRGGYEGTTPMPTLDQIAQAFKSAPQTARTKKLLGVEA